MPDFLHARRDFDQLLALVADERGLDPMLVEKDYWIMHCLWGLQAQGFQFELKGGTSLSKGFGVIHRFSEDIDIRIEPLDGMDVRRRMLDRYRTTSIGPDEEALRTAFLKCGDLMKAHECTVMGLAVHTQNNLDGVVRLSLGKTSCACSTGTTGST